MEAPPRPMPPPASPPPMVEKGPRLSLEVPTGSEAAFPEDDEPLPDAPSHAFHEDSRSSTHRNPMKKNETFQRDGAEVASKFLKDTHLRSTDLILVPCNVHYNHWALSVVDLKNHVIIVFDSRYCDKDAQYILECMLGFISTCFPNTFEIDHWNCYAGVYPQQKNSVASIISTHGGEGPQAVPRGPHRV
ncbi:unnamed protein product [Bemisia tabaci]|uniref:Ubiquitin-like protease family profile domain-containing protein n=1 Tax=Bemisia tabaci TaxID=7038 RepID=A0A9P0AP31_BEMTA|nr:unnamed protein product [Bemisia tabaci]